MTGVEQWALVRTQAPTEEPITLDEAKSFLRVTQTQDDDLITSLIKAGRERCEKVTGRAMVSQTWRLNLDEWPCDDVIRVPRPPLQSVSSIKYVDTAGTQQTIAAAEYRVDANGEPGRIEPAYGESWPTVREQSNTIEVIFVAGYGAAAAVPNEIKEAIKAYVAYCFEHRTDRDEEYLDRLFERFGYGQYS